MNAFRWLMRALIFVAVLAALAFWPQVAAAQGGIDVDSVESSPYGIFNGVDYVKHAGRFVGTATGDYSVPFEIVAPADPTQGNGALVVEPFHPLGGAIGCQAYLGAEFAFGQRFSCAGVGWHPDTVDPFAGYSTEEAVEILHNFAVTLKEDPAATDMVGDVQNLYGLGVSLTCSPLYDLLDSPGKGLLDFTFLLGPAWPNEAYELPLDNRLIVFLAEADIVLSKMGSLHTDALRGSSSTYRSYEGAGGPHVPDAPIIRAMGAQMGLTTAGTLDWTPVARALFVAGHRWATEGVEPPPSVFFAEAPAGEIDAVYQSQYGLELETGIARDENGNALGGIRLPDIEVGRIQYIAVDPGSWGGGRLGSSVDLACEPLADGSPRFPDHGSYVSRFTEQAQKLVGEGFLLPEDADRLIGDADQSGVGDPGACAPSALPETGAKDSGGYFQLLALVGLILVSAGIGFRQWVKACGRVSR